MKKHKHTPSKRVEFCECGAARDAGGRWGTASAGQLAARALVSRYVQSTTPEERSEVARKSSESRWAGKTKQRDEFMRQIAKKPRPSAVIQDRCPCGKFSRFLAEKRGHKCQAEAV